MVALSVFGFLGWLAMLVLVIVLTIVVFAILHGGGNIP